VTDFLEELGLMTFEEEFPSFNDEVERWVCDEYCIKTIQKRLQLLCFDKQKVKEAWDKFRFYSSEIDQYAADEFEKELGL